VRVQKVYSGQPGAAEGGAVVRQEFYVGCGDFNIQLIGSFYVRDVVIFDCIQESVGEDQDEMVRRRGGASVFIRGWRILGGITVAQCLVQVANMIGWSAANQASLVSTRRGSRAGSLSFLVRSLGGVSMQWVLMERSNWIHVEGLPWMVL